MKQIVRVLREMEAGLIGGGVSVPRQRGVSTFSAKVTALSHCHPEQGISQRPALVSASYRPLAADYNLDLLPVCILCCNHCLPWGLWGHESKNLLSLVERDFYLGFC